MTLAPCEPVRITIPAQDGWIDNGDPELCQAPNCRHLAVGTHHIVRRSATGGPKRWVAIDGVVLCNETRLCAFCHEDINVHKAWIAYFTGLGWLWYARRRPVDGPVPSTTPVLRHPKSLSLFVRVGPLKEVTFGVQR